MSYIMSKFHVCAADVVQIVGVGERVQIFS